MPFLDTTMIVKRAESSSLLRGRHQRRTGHESDPERVTASADAQTGLGAGRTRRQGGPSQDQALYACSCGYAFAALVSTSVDCPACGSTQAW